MDLSQVKSYGNEEVDSILSGESDAYEAQSLRINDDIFRVYVSKQGIASPYVKDKVSHTFFFISAGNAEREVVVAAKALSSVIFPGKHSSSFSLEKDSGESYDFVPSFVNTEYGQKLSYGHPLYAKVTVNMIKHNYLYI